MELDMQDNIIEDGMVDNTGVIEEMPEAISRAQVIQFNNSQDELLQDNNVKEAVEDESVSQMPHQPSHKLTYEELKDICSQQQQYINKANQELQFLRDRVDVTRIELMFKILDNASLFDASFVQKVVEFISTLMTPPTQEELTGISQE